MVAILSLATLFLTTSFYIEPDRVTLVGAGDIAGCANHAGEETAKLVEALNPDAVFTVRDNVYESGTKGEFDSCYTPGWGRLKDRTYPSPGNHDYGNKGYGNRDAGSYEASGYFGEAAGDPDEGYYSYELGDWHVIVLNSMCELVGGCGEDSPQIQWLEVDLATTDRRCILAYWHHPLFSSASRKEDSRMRPAWDALHEAGAEVVLNGHDHAYERFLPQDPEGNADPEGIREFVVGTGGKSLYMFNEPLPNSEVRGNEAYGVLRLSLMPDSYGWEFVPIEGMEFRDSGSGKCN